MKLYPVSNWCVYIYRRKFSFSNKWNVEVYTWGNILRRSMIYMTSMDMYVSDSKKRWRKGMMKFYLGAIWCVCNDGRKFPSVIKKGRGLYLRKYNPSIDDLYDFNGYVYIWLGKALMGKEISRWRILPRSYLMRLQYRQKLDFSNKRNTEGSTRRSRMSPSLEKTLMGKRFRWTVWDSIQDLYL